MVWMMIVHLFFYKRNCIILLHSDSVFSHSVREIDVIVMPPEVNVEPLEEQKAFTY